jgi:hypothetical protein
MSEMETTLRKRTPIHNVRQIRGNVGKCNETQRIVFRCPNPFNDDKLEYFTYDEMIKILLFTSNRDFPDMPLRVPPAMFRKRVFVALFSICSIKDVRRSKFLMMTTEEAFKECAFAASIHNAPVVSYMYALWEQPVRYSKSPFPFAHPLLHHRCTKWRVWPDGTVSFLPTFGVLNSEHQLEMEHNMIEILKHNNVSRAEAKVIFDVHFRQAVQPHARDCIVCKQYTSHRCGCCFKRMCGVACQIANGCLTADVFRAPTNTFSLVF